MIAFEELSAALDRWRIRNGLPVVSADLPIVPDSERPAAAPPFVMPAAAPATQPRTAAPAPAQPARPATDGDVYAMDDADVMEEDEYNNEGSDFSMSFGGAPAPANQAAPAPASPPAQIYEESADYEVAEQATHVADDAGGYQDPAYDTPQPLEAAPPLPEYEEDEEEDWSKMPNFPGHAPGPDTIDAGDEVLDEAEDDDRKR